jgi:hypothetical protein
MNQINFAEIAVELKLSDTSFAEMSVALWLQAHSEHERQQRLEQIAARIGLSPSIASKIVADESRHTACVVKAYEIFKALIPHEKAVMALIDGG